MKVLSFIGFSVRGARNGEEALSLWKEWRPRLILMDVHMPGMDGLEATRRIKADPQGQETFIIIHTANALDEDRRTALQSGADDFLTKPCREEELLESMRALLSVVYDYESVSANGSERVAEPPKWRMERLRQLPRELIEELREATENGNKRLLDRLILKLRETVDSETFRALQNLADKYEYDALRHLLKEAYRR
jgi:CheY-like chemotaxis protein